MSVVRVSIVGAKALCYKIIILFLNQEMGKNKMSFEELPSPSLEVVVMYGL